MISILGQLASTSSFVVDEDYLGHPVSYRPLFEPIQRRCSLMLNHQVEVGQVVGYFQGRAAGVCMVAMAPDDPDLVQRLRDEPLYCSAKVLCQPDERRRLLRHQRIQEVSLTWEGHQRTTGIRPIVWRQGNIQTDPGMPSGMSLTEQDCWRQAHAWLAARRFRWRDKGTDDLELVDLDPCPPEAPGASGRVRLQGQELGASQSHTVRRMLDVGLSPAHIIQLVRPG
jgi:hypothetical protein